jgi:hypothetical protein
VLQALPKKARSLASRPAAVPQTSAEVPHLVVANVQARSPAQREPLLEKDPSFLLLDLSRIKLVEALDVLQRGYPELCLVHLADNIQRWGAPHDSILELKVSLILALGAGCLGEADVRSRITDQQALMSLQDALWPRMMQRPDVDMVQCLLLISQREWSQGNGYAAWMYTGLAARMFQGLEVMSQVQQTAPSNLDIHLEDRETVVKRETTRRTYWTCYLMDRMLTCSGDRPSMTALPRPTIPLPSSEDDFELGVAGEDPVIYTPNANHSTAPTGRPLLTIHNHFEIVIRSLEIWSNTCQWVAQGGRRQPLMHSTCPWEPSSPWHQIVVSLGGLRKTLHPRMRFPDTPVALYLPRRQGERYAFNNLIYYCT